MGWAYYTMLRNYSSQGFSIVTEQGILPALVIILAFTAGSAVVMWLGEQITEFGIGNGISMILFANIVSGLPRMVSTLFTMAWWQIIIVVIGMVALVLFIIFINDAERRIPIPFFTRIPALNTVKPFSSKRSLALLSNDSKPSMSTLNS